MQEWLLRPGKIGAAVVVLCTVLQVSWTSPARACGPLGPGETPPEVRDDVSMETAGAVYLASAAVMAIGAPVTAFALDDSGRFPLLPTLGVSLLTGLGGWMAAMALSASHDDNPCGPGDLYEEHVVLYDLFPLAFAAAPTPIAWTLSEASFQDAAPRAQLGLGAVVEPRRGGLVFVRLQL
ncbi:MAG: hypothetical protein OEZ06_15500 [Myxococcales bacterium]|nr:hypothetical protein [Myxococcales bacterium]